MTHGERNREYANCLVGQAKRTHQLKCWPVPFRAIREGRKHHELRRNDRDYQTTDRVVLNEWNPIEQKYTGWAITVYIGDLAKAGGEWPGLQEGFCCFTILHPNPDVIVVENIQARARIEQHDRRASGPAGGDVPL